MDDKYLENMMLDRCWQRITSFNEAEEMLNAQRLKSYKEVLESTCAILLQAYPDVQALLFGQDQYGDSEMVWGAELPDRYYIEPGEGEHVFSWPVRDDLRDERFFCPDELGAIDDYIKPEHLTLTTEIIEQLGKLASFVRSNMNMHQQAYGLRSLIADRTGMNNNG